MSATRSLSLLALLVLVAGLCACDSRDRNDAAPKPVPVQLREQQQPAEKPTARPAERDTSGETPRIDEAFDNYIDKGDLDAMRKRGTIRFVSLSGGREALLFRKAIVTRRHYDLAMQFAQWLELDPLWVQAETPGQAIEILREGRADIVADNLTETGERRRLLELSTPLQQTTQKLVTRKGGPDISSAGALKNVTIAVLPGSTYLETARRIAAENPGARLQIEEQGLGQSLDMTIDNLVRQEDTVTIMDSNLIDNLLQYREDLKVGADVSETENIVWAMRKDSPQLETRLNKFLARQLVRIEPRRPSNWKSIKQSNVLRLLTRNGPTSYFIWKGQLMGFDYDLARAFAEKNRLDLEVVVVPPGESLVEWLKRGRGDIAGASTAITRERLDRGVDFTVPYMEMAEQVISSAETPIRTLKDLNGRTLTVRANSSFVATARSLRDRDIYVKVKVAPADVSYEQLVNMVADGEIEATIVDTHVAETGAALRPDLVAGPLVTEPRPQGWMVVKGSAKLKEKLDQFLTEFHASRDYGQKVAAYFKPDNSYAKKSATPVAAGEELSPYDDLAKASAREHDFDWRLLVAIMWQESRFDPEMESPLGAQGLLQVMPRTAEEFGYPPPLFEPEKGIGAGVVYLSWLRDRLPPDIGEDERRWFTLAAYNAGYGHLQDARRLAGQLGLSPDKWFDNVELAMLKLSEPHHFRSARYGYVRGAEPVWYVRYISERYEAYVGNQATETKEVSLHEHRETSPVAPLRKFLPPTRRPLVFSH